LIKDAHKVACAIIAEKSIARLSAVVYQLRNADPAGEKLFPATLGACKTISRALRSGFASSLYSRVLCKPRLHLIAGHRRSALRRWGLALSAASEIRGAAPAKHNTHFQFDSCEAAGLDVVRPFRFRDRTIAFFEPTTRRVGEFQGPDN